MLFLVIFAISKYVQGKNTKSICFNILSYLYVNCDCSLENSFKFSRYRIVYKASFFNRDISFGYILRFSLFSFRNFHKQKNKIVI